MNRRHFIGTTLASIIAASVKAAEHRPPRILLRSSWQTVNIGDIAHTPGVLAILGEHLPDAEITLWPSSVDNGVKELLVRNFPKLTFALDATAQRQAMQDADFFLHGSGPGFVGQKSCASWVASTKKPYGIYGITYSGKDEESKALLSGAKFAFFRDSHSLQFAKARGITCPIMEFGPDGAFGTKIANDAAAEAFLKANGLETGKFLCCISRMRITPYWLVPSKNRPVVPASVARNDEMKEHDHAQLRAAIVTILKDTDLKILLCPEDETQMAANKEMIYDKLPEELKSRVVWRENYWLTDEALSTYRRSAGLFGNEMHSPIMCIGNGIPAIVCRWKEQTTKGYMWDDIGLNDLLFDLDKDEEVARVAPAIVAMAKDPAGSKAKAAKARAFVEKRQRETMAILKQSLTPA
jgi:hypothetical protein